MKPIRFYLIALIILISDQFTKWVVVHNLGLGASKPILGSYFLLTYQQNTGGAFSLFPAGNKTFIVVAIFAIGALVYAYHRYQKVNPTVSAALGLALGGAVGNLIDRLQYGYVIDFFDVRAIKWPVFNVADSAITIGIFLLAWHFLFSKEPEKAGEQSTVISNQTTASGEALNTDH